MNTRAQPPPPNRESGCFGKGCLILIAFGVLLLVVGVGGSWWSVRHVYLSDKPSPIPQATTPAETGTVTPEATSAPAPPRETITAARERLETMKQAASAHERTGVEFTAGDINALIAANKKSRGLASVNIDGNVAHVLFSIPLERLHVPLRDTLGLADRYLNGSVTVVAPPGTNASNVQPSEVTINGHSFPNDLLDRGLFGIGSLRSYVIKYASQYGVTDGEIRDGKVILHTSGY